MENVESNQPETAGPQPALPHVSVKKTSASDPGLAAGLDFETPKDPPAVAPNQSDLELNSETETPQKATSTHWQNRFETPALKTLLQYDRDHPKSPGTLVAKIHTAIAELKSVLPLVRWQGHSWCWTITYHHPATPRGGPAEFAYFIPNTQGLQLVVPFNESLSAAFAEADHLNGDAFLSKALAIAPHPHEYLWPIWNPTNDAQADAILNLIRWKHAQLTRK